MNDKELAKLQRAFRDNPAPAGSDCPDAEQIWQALAGTLKRAELEQIVKHIGVCSACAACWRLAHDLGAMAERADAVSAERVSSRRGFFSFAKPLAWAAGLAALAAVALVFIRPPASETGPVYRTMRQGAVESLLIRALEGLRKTLVPEMGDDR